MTSKLTKERVVALIAEHSYDSALVDALEHLLAAMDSEPVAEVLSNRPGNDTSTIDRALPVGTQLYLHAQPVPVVPEEITSASAPEVFEIAAEAERLGLRGTYASYAVGWNACRSAMLQELKKSAGTEAICRSDENVQVLHTKSPAQSDCCPAQNSINPAQGGNFLVIPDEMTSGQAYEIGYYYGDPVDVFARGANWMRQHIIDSTLAAAPQADPVVPDDVLAALQKVARIRLDLNDFDGDRRGIVDCLSDAEEALIEVVNSRAAMLAAAPQSTGSELATVPGKWIPVSEQMPPSRHEVLVGRWWGEKPRWCCKWATYIPGHPDAQSSGWLIPGASWTPTHWMPLPAAPQEVKSES